MAKRKRVSSDDDDDWRPRASGGKAQQPYIKTRAAKAQAHLQAVLETKELLEIIFLNLPMKKLFVFQRVSKCWKKVISETTSIQERMYLRAVAQPVGGHTEPTQAIPRYSGSICVNPTTQFGRVIWERQHRTSSKRSDVIQATCSIAGGEDLHINFSTTRLESGKGHSEPNPFSGSDGTWRNMFLTQPPIIKVKSWAMSVGRKYMSPKGITLGELDDVLRRIEALPSAYGDVERAGRAIALLSLRTDDMDQGLVEAIKLCKGHKDWNGLCACQWMLQKH